MADGQFIGVTVAGGPQSPFNVQDYAIRCRDLLALEAWKIVVKELDVAPPGTDYDWRGDCVVDFPYACAVVRVRRIPQAADLKATIMHEMLHVLFGYLSYIVRAHILLDVSAPRQPGLRLLFDDAQEHTIERIAHILVRQVEETP